MNLQCQLLRSSRNSRFSEEGLRVTLDGRRGKEDSLEAAYAWQGRRFFLDVYGGIAGRVCLGL